MYCYKSFTRKSRGTDPLISTEHKLQEKEISDMRFPLAMSESLKKREKASEISLKFSYVTPLNSIVLSFE